MQVELGSEERRVGKGMGGGEGDFSTVYHKKKVKKNYSKIGDKEKPLILGTSTCKLYVNREPILN